MNLLIYYILLLNIFIIFESNFDFDYFMGYQLVIYWVKGLHLVTDLYQILNLYLVKDSRYFEDLCLVIDLQPVSVRDL